MSDNGWTMQVDIVIVSYNTRELLRACLDSVRRWAPEAHTIVVDNASRDDSPAMVRDEFSWATLDALEVNLGFGAANNRGVALGEAPLLLFLNPDAELTEGALTALVACLEESPKCAMAGPVLLNPDGSFQLSCRRFPTLLRNLWCFSGLGYRFPNRPRGLQNWLSEAEHANAVRVDMVSGACFLARRDYFDSVGGFDENLFIYEEESDLALPAKGRGLDVRYCREARVIHHGGASVSASEMGAFSRRQLFRSKYCCMRKHYGAFYTRAVYANDLLVFGLSAGLNRLRGTDSDASDTVRACRRAWRESFEDARKLRHEPRFFA